MIKSQLMYSMYNRIAHTIRVILLHIQPYHQRSIPLGLANQNLFLMIKYVPSHNGYVM